MIKVIVGFLVMFGLVVQASGIAMWGNIFNSWLSAIGTPLRAGAGNLTGGTRGANSTSAAAHNSGAAVILVRMALRQEKTSGYRISDWATDQNGTSITIGDIINNTNYKNNISPPTEITMYKT